jgi:hypothetical protein
MSDVSHYDDQSNCEGFVQISLVLRTSTEHVSEGTASATHRMIAC